MGVKSFFNKVGFHINRGFNKFKEHARYYIPKIKKIAPYVIAAGGALAGLPAVVPAVNALGAGIAAGAAVLETGAYATEIGLDVAEIIQDEFGWEKKYIEGEKYIEDEK